MAEEMVTRGDLEALRGELKDDIHSVRTKLKDEIASTRLDVANLRTEMSERFGSLQAGMNERFGAVQAECGAVRADLADARKELAVLQVDICKDLAAHGQQQDQMRQEMRDMRHEMNQWRTTTTRQLWTMGGITGGPFTVILGALIKLVFFPGP